MTAQMVRDIFWTLWWIATLYTLLGCLGNLIMLVADRSRLKKISWDQMLIPCIGWAVLIMFYFN